MAAKHARHDMREDKNFKGTDPSETTAQYLYCVFTLGLHIFARCIINGDVYSKRNSILTNIVKEIAPNASQRKV